MGAPARHSASLQCSSSLSGNPFHHSLKSACVLVHSTILLEERSTAGSMLPGPKRSSTTLQLTRQSDAEMPYSSLVSQLAANLRHEPCNGL